MAKRATKVVRGHRSPRVKYEAFGGLLKALRGDRSVQQVVNSLERQEPLIQTSQGTVSGYENGYVKKIDPVVIWGLAQTYNQPHDGLVAVLQANRHNPGLSLTDAQEIVQRYKNGPSPAMAATAIAKAEGRIFETAAYLAEVREQIAPTVPPYDENETKPRR
jgi:transcriptional regulator with XRE-family HTH domain